MHLHLSLVLLSILQIAVVSARRGGRGGVDRSNCTVLEQIDCSGHRYTVPKTECDAGRPFIHCEKRATMIGGTWSLSTSVYYSANQLGNVTCSWRQAGEIRVALPFKADCELSISELMAVCGVAAQQNTTVPASTVGDGGECRNIPFVNCGGRVFTMRKSDFLSGHRFLYCERIGVRDADTGAWTLSTSTFAAETRVEKLSCLARDQKKIHVVLPEAPAHDMDINELMRVCQVTDECRHLKSVSCNGYNYQMSMRDCLDGRRSIHCEKIATRNAVFGNWSISTSAFASTSEVRQVKCVQRHQEELRVVLPYAVDCDMNEIELTNVCYAQSLPSIEGVCRNIPATVCAGQRYPMAKRDFLIGKRFIYCEKIAVRKDEHTPWSFSTTTYSSERSFDYASCLLSSENRVAVVLPTNVDLELTVEEMLKVCETSYVGLIIFLLFFVALPLAFCAVCMIRERIIATWNNYTPLSFVNLNFQMRA